MWLVFVLLGTFGWAVVNVLDSILVHHYEKRPMSLMWSQSMVSLPLLLAGALFLPLESDWKWILMAFGILAYLGDLWFFHVLEHIDVSVTNSAWSILSLFLAIAGFIFFQESWATQQWIGAVLIISGALFLSFYHQHINLGKTLWLLTSLALLYAPYYIIKKVAVDDGVLPVTVFYWLILSREVFGFTVPLFIPSVRKPAIAAIKKSPWFMFLNAAVILCFFAAEYFGALAYNAGPLSVVAVVSNLQPFVVMGLAGLVYLLFPRKMPKELLTGQSIGIKVVSFAIVFIGLALLTTAQ